MPALKARSLNSRRRNMGSGTLVSMTQERRQQPDACEQLGEHGRVRPAHGVAAVGLDTVGDTDHHERQPDGEGDVAGPVHPCPAPHAPVLELQVGPDGAKGPKGTETRKISRQSIGASSPPTTRPRNDPLIPATLLMPRASPRWFSGKASVKMAAEFGHEEGGADALEDAEPDEVERPRRGRSASPRSR